MIKHSIHFAVALLTFAIAAGVTSLRNTLNRPHPSSASAPEAQPPAAKVEIKRTYQSLMRASGRAGKHQACFGVFSSSDGMKFSTTNIYFDTPNHARRELQRKLKKAVEIVSREQVLAANGRVTREEVVATFPPYDKQSVLSAELIVVEGSDFVSIGSFSLHNITEYKRDRQH